MNNLKVSRPDSSEYASYYDHYISLVKGEDILASLQNQLSVTLEILGDVSDEKALYRYEEDKWSVKEVVAHMVDIERIFAYRACRIARGDKTPTAGMDQDHYISNSDFDTYNLEDLNNEFSLGRRANILMLSGLSEEAWLRTGTASDCVFSTRGLAYVIAGHELHHIDIIRRKYL